MGTASIISPKIFYVDLNMQAAGLAPSPPFWMLTIIARWRQHAGDRLVALERRIVTELGIELDADDEKWSSELVSPFYRSENDCRRVAVELMRRRRGVRVFVTPCDQKFGETYSPIADTEMTRLVIANPFQP